MSGMAGTQGILRTGGLSRRRATPVALVPDAADRARLAEALGLLSLPAFRFEGEVRPAGREDFDLAARLVATAVQACVVTLDPVETAVERGVTRRFLAGMADPGPGESEVPEDTDSEPLPEVLDLWAVAGEELMLALPLYPRRPGAALPDPGPAAGEADDPRPNPFAALKRLTPPGT